MVVKWDKYLLWDENWVGGDVLGQAFVRNWSLRSIEYTLPLSLDIYLYHIQNTLNEQTLTLSVEKSKISLPNIFKDNMRK